MPALTKDLLHTDFLQGAMLAVDKPQGWTSFDAVNKIRGLLRRKYAVKKIKVGHSGTLDPMATGLLLVCIGPYTKELQLLTGLDKIYEGEITLGVETATFDAMGEVVSQGEVPDVSESDIRMLLQQFTGDIEQYPPAYSAIKQGGKKLYELARAGKEVVVEPRNVRVFNIQLMQLELPRMTIRIHCGSGFYVRSLAHDLGQRLGCGGHLSALRRTSIGDFKLEDAFRLEEIEKMLMPE